MIKNHQLRFFISIDRKIIFRIENPNCPPIAIHKTFGGSSDFCGGGWISAPLIICWRLRRLGCSEGG